MDGGGLGDGVRNLYPRRWLVMMGPIRSKPSPLPHSLTHSLTLPLIFTVFEPNLEFRLIGSPTSADFVEGAPKHRTE